MYVLKCFFRRAKRWGKRLFFGAKTEWNSEDIENEIESPSHLLKEAFFGKKTSVFALILLATIFLFVFIAPIFAPMDVNYTDPLQQNVPPSFSLRSPPRKLRKSVEMIDGFSDFSVGLSKDGDVFVWGNTDGGLLDIDFKKIPEDVTKEGAVFVSAGKDHVIAVTKTGKIVGWGDKSCGQYGGEPILNVLPMPSELLSPISPDTVAHLSCGYQATALTLTDGRAYLWGNQNAVRNLADLQNLQTSSEVKKVEFTNSVAIALLKSGRITTGAQTFFTSAVSLKNGEQKRLDTPLDAYLVGRNVIEIAAGNKCIALLTEEGELIVSGVFENGEDVLPHLKKDEKFLFLDGGTRHFLGVTDQGNVYAWGHNAYGQCDIRSSKIAGKAQRAYAGSLQSYVVDGDGKLIESAGLRGYLMGTDGRGRDVFTRIIHGGKMTLTIGAVAVLVSSVIAIVVGCLSGYFGGWIDTLLMRITEIFASMPFLPLQCCFPKSSKITAFPKRCAFLSLC